MRTPWNPRGSSCRRGGTTAILAESDLFHAYGQIEQKKKNPSVSKWDDVCPPEAKSIQTRRSHNKRNKRTPAQIATRLTRSATPGVGVDTSLSSSSSSRRRRRRRRSSSSSSSSSSGSSSRGWE
ncbi:hypothetical protein RUM44_013657 [Polyplax serrata]|uniref:Uncharacterized protein n=1 Tax=Polyplax serrata TaxID=468196 RepID=A0ABR1BIW4_POLSC